MADFDYFPYAVDYIRNTPKGDFEPDNETKLTFYALYKQATVGPCSQHGGSQPWAVQLEARAKWDAWNAQGELDSETAKKLYVHHLTKKAPTWFQKYQTQ